MNFNSIGADIEVFAKDVKGNHKAVCGLIGGTKEEPLPIGTVPGFFVQEDNVSLEYNIPICFSLSDFKNSISHMRDKIIPSVLEKHHLSMSTDASVSFDKMELLHPNALIFGCEPDYDAWKKVENQKPKSKDETLRTAGGHIHVGSSLDFLTGIRNMDLFLGVPSVLLDDKPSSMKRRELYGKAGAMRPKPYGWEYRVLSNFWMFSDKLTSWVYNNTRLSCDFNHKFTAKEAKEIQNCINTGDKDAATKIIQTFGIALPS